MQTHRRATHTRAAVSSDCVVAPLALRSAASRESVPGVGRGGGTGMGDCGGNSGTVSVASDEDARTLKALPIWMKDVSSVVIALGFFRLGHSSAQMRGLKKDSE